MRIAIGRAACMLAPLFILAGCGNPATVVKGSADGSEGAARADAAAPEAQAPAPNEAPSQKCLAENYKLEAARRWKEVQLEPLFMEAGLHSRMASLMNAVTETAAGKKFDIVDGQIAKIWQELKSFRPGTSDSDLELMKNVARRRIIAYSACRAMASRDPSWCAGLEIYSKDSAASCYWNYATFAIIGDEAILKGKSCEEACGSFSGIALSELLSACNAVKEKKPGLCPWDETSTSGAFCRAAAQRAGGNDCQKIAGEDRVRDAACCEHYAWRFANVSSGHADPYVIPEGGALAGDEKGCMNALSWGLMDDLGALFGLEVPEKSAGEFGDSIYGDYLCPMVIYWSQREPPKL